MPTLRSALAPALALLLLACNGGSGEEEQARSGEVLEGTISDAMLPLGTVRSQPPLADPEAASAARSRGASSGESADASAEGASTAADDPEAAAAAEPDAEPAEADSAAADD